MERREAAIRGQNRWKVLGGLIIILAALAVVATITKWIDVHRDIMRPVAQAPGDKPLDLATFLMVFDSALMLATFLMALFTRQESRSDMIDQFIETGSRTSSSHDNPGIRWFLIVIMLGLLQGEFLLIDAFRATQLRFKLRGVDRYRAALILASVTDHPAGIDPRLQLRMGEDPLQLRPTIAYLMAYEWTDIAPQGDWLTLLSPAKRAQRH